MLVKRLNGCPYPVELPALLVAGTGVAVAVVQRRLGPAPRPIPRPWIGRCRRQRVQVRCWSRPTTMTRPPLLTTNPRLVRMA